MSKCRHGGGIHDKRTRACRACLEDVASALRQANSKLESRLAEVAELDTVLKKNEKLLSRRREVINWISWSDTVFGYVIRNPHKPDLALYLADQRHRIKEFVRSFDF